MLEMKSPEMKENMFSLILNQISEWIESERPYFETVQEYEQMYDDHLTHPDAEDSTPLGKYLKMLRKVQLSLISLVLTHMADIIIRGKNECKFLRI